jgi:hypothetical protein
MFFMQCGFLNGGFYWSHPSSFSSNLGAWSTVQSQTFVTGSFTAISFVQKQQKSISASIPAMRTCRTFFNFVEN